MKPGIIKRLRAASPEHTKAIQARLKIAAIARVGNLVARFRCLGSVERV